MSLVDKYRDVLQMLDKEPKNEQQTKDWVIRPVLEEVLGYHKLEIVPEVSGPGNARPDYTILPDTSYTWLLEAKDWSETLSDQHALQATTYAYQNGTRWVVLNNGQEWRLYDSFVTGGGVTERLVLCATLDDAEALEALFQALHRATVVGGNLETELNRYLLAVYLRQELQRADSECVTALRNVTRKKPRFEKTTGADIVEALAKAFAPKEPQPGRGADMPATEERCEAAAVPISEAEGVPLNNAGKPTNKKPAAIILPDGTRLEVDTWCKLWLAVFQYAVEHGREPLPVPWVPKHTNRYWVNEDKSAGSGHMMRAPVQVNLAHRTVFVETHASAISLISVSAGFCRAMGIDPATIRLVYR